MADYSPPAHQGGQQPIWRWWGVSLLLAVGLVLFFFHLGGYALIDPDEPVYGETAREMIVLGDWLSPHMDFRPWFDKPIFFYWLTILSFKFFGISEFAARFWSALLALGGTFLTYRFGVFLFGSRRQALLAALILATSFEFIVMARASVTDMTLTFFMSGALFLFYLGFSEPGARGAYWGIYPLCALATLTKGPMGTLLPLGIIGLFLLLTRRLGEVRRMHAIPGGLLLVGLVAPWYVAMYYLHGVEFGNSFLIQYNVGRFLQPEHVHRPYLYYVPILILGLFPWGAFFPVVLYRTVRRWRDPRLLFPLVWVCVIFFFFSAAESKLPSYILPLFPAAALLLGSAWWHPGDEGPPDPPMVWASAGTPLLGAALILLPLLSTQLLDRYPKAVQATGLLGSLLLVLGILVLAFLVRRRWEQAFALQVVLMALFIPLVLLRVMPEAERYASTRSLARLVARPADSGAEVASFRYYRPSMTFYSQKVVQRIERDEALANFLGSGRRVYCFIKRKSLDDFQQAYPGTPVHRLGDEGGLVLISNRG